MDIHPLCCSKFLASKEKYYIGLQIPLVSFKFFIYSENSVYSTNSALQAVLNAAGICRFKWNLM